jgi:hypothetical protein
MHAAARRSSATTSGSCITSPCSKATSIKKVACSADRDPSGYSFEASLRSVEI